jgi:phenylpropionate dioxygenase-like ring-hydroxylating dioxygenase large terminal subunit
MSAASPFLTGTWYPVARLSSLSSRRPLSRQVAGLPLLIGRMPEPWVLVDSCPHRGLPLRYGRVTGRVVRCKYHGWDFDTGTGRCLHIPCLTPEQRSQGVEGRLRARSLPCRQQGGLLWAWFSHAHRSEPDAGPITLPAPFDRDPDLYLERTFQCDIDQAVIGLMDPAHLPFIHTSRWWKQRDVKALQRETKRFTPRGRGFVQDEHIIASPAAPYRLLGLPVRTEIGFELPGVRLELIRGPRGSACSLTTIAPIDDHTSRVHQALYWTTPWLRPLRGLIAVLAGRFLDQDRLVVEEQQQGLRHNPPLTLIDGADTQARWYLRLKRDYRRALEQGEPFQNPLRPATVEWLC